MLLEAVVLCVPWQLLAKRELGKDVITKGLDASVVIIRDTGIVEL